MRNVLLLVVAALVACTGQISAPGTTSAVGGSGGDVTVVGGGAGGGEELCPAPGATGTPAPYLSPTRQLRRIRLALTGRAPTAPEYQALLDATDDAARQAILDRAVEDALASPTFYTVMQDFGREWISMPSIASVADEPDYMGNQQHNISQCPAGTPLAGAWALWDPYAADHPPCSGFEPDGSPVVQKQIEPWWAPGTTVKVLGTAANESATAIHDGQPYDCGTDFTMAELPAFFSYMSIHAVCGCGPHMVYCHPSLSAGYANWAIWALGNPDGQRRQLWEEPARLVAHLAWHDRPLSELVVGNTSVGPVEVQVAYVRQGRRSGAVALDDDDSWWRPAKLTGLTDPFHSGNDPHAWREFSVPARDPYLLAERDYKFDPRTEPRGTMRGMPAAGVLTMIGMLGAYPRERVRAARMLEAFACETFIPPPAGQVFNPYVSDPAVEGPCQTCHSRIDPAAIHFKRWSKIGYNAEGGGAYITAGIGNWHFANTWTTGAYPYGGEPFARWLQWFKPGSKLTPVTEADATREPETRFIDFLPPDQQLLGQVSDGTVGPLGLGKMLISSGAFDTCAVQRLHERFVGRRLDPGTESGYLRSLVESFVAGGRQARPFVRTLMKSDAFRRGL